MEKFKVGDRVEWVDIQNDISRVDWIGKTGTIDRCEMYTDTAYVKLDCLDGEITTWTPSRLELCYQSYMIRDINISR